MTDSERILKRLCGDLHDAIIDADAFESRCTRTGLHTLTISVYNQAAHADLVEKVKEKFDELRAEIILSHAEKIADLTLQLKAHLNESLPDRPLDQGNN